MRDARKQMEVRPADRFLRLKQRACRAGAGPVPSSCATWTGHVSRLVPRTRARVARLQENEDLNILMSGLRGSNMNEQDFASDGVVMNVVEVASENFGDSLPLMCEEALSHKQPRLVPHEHVAHAQPSTRL